MDRKLAAMVLAAVVFVGTAGVAAVAGGPAVGNYGGDTTVAVSATGSVTAQPDRAEIFLRVSADGETAANATDRLAANVSAVRAALDEQALDVVSVRTTGFQVFQRVEDGSSEYVASQSLVATTADPDAAGPVIDAAVASGATGVDGVAFALSEERRLARRADAIDAAVEDARAQAAAAADSADLTLGSVRTVTAGDGGVGPVRAADEGTTIDVSPVVVSASVQVTYNATGG
jgi:uncharacterized protein YggE